MLLTVLGVVVGVVVMKAHKDFEKDVTIVLDGETLKSLDVSLTGFYPGMSKEYVIALKCEAEGEYEVSLSFEKKGTGELQNYIQTEIEVDGERVAMSELKSFFDGETAVFDCNLTKSKSVKLVIRYTMPQEVGNEAQGATSDFDLVVSASKK